MMARNPKREALDPHAHKMVQWKKINKCRRCRYHRDAIYKCECGKRETRQIRCKCQEGK